MLVVRARPLHFSKGVYVISIYDTDYVFGNVIGQNEGDYF